MSYHCNVVIQAAQKVLSVRTRSPVQDLPDLIGKTYQEIYHHMMDNGANPSGVPFVGYFNMDMNDLDIEIGFPVSDNVPEKGNIKMSEIPSGKFASTIYTGPYSGLESAYNALMKWMEENDYTGTGIGYEFYLNDPQETPENELQTKILFELKRLSSAIC